MKQYKCDITRNFKSIDYPFDYLYVKVKVRLEDWSFVEFEVGERQREGVLTVYLSKQEISGQDSIDTLVKFFSDVKFNDIVDLVSDLFLYDINCENVFLITTRTLEVKE